MSRWINEFLIRWGVINYMNDAFVEKRIAEYSKMRKLYQDFAEQILSIIKNILLAEHPEIKIASCSSRAKEISSLKKKLQKDKYNNDSEITDLAGVRLIVYSKKDIEIISQVIQKCFSIDEKNSIDKTEVLGNDKVGYRAKHYVIYFGPDRMSMYEYHRYKGLKCEIQLTTLIAHTWSEITHEKGYKFEGKLPNDLDRRKNLLAGMLELADLEMDAYVAAFDEYVQNMECENEKGTLDYSINSLSLEKFIKWKFPDIEPVVYRDVDLVLDELKRYGLKKICELDSIIRPEFVTEISNAGWRSLDGIIRNILIIDDAEKYFSSVWNPSMNQMNIKNYDLYKRFGVGIEEICKKYKISKVG